MLNCTRPRHAADMFSVVPRRQIVDIFSDWLEIKDIGRFDSAACDSNVRKLFLDLVQADYFVFRGSAYKFIAMFKIPFFEWSIKRRFRVADLTIYDAIIVHDKLRIKYLTTTGKTLESIAVSDADNKLHVSNNSLTVNNANMPLQNVFYDIGQWCPNLVYLKVEGKTLNDAYCLPLARCARLQALAIINCTGLSNIILRSMCDLLNLEELELNGAHFSSEALQYGHTQCSSLKKLTVRGSKLQVDDLATLVCLFPNLTFLKVSELDCTSLLRVVDACPQIKTAFLQVKAALPDSAAHVIAKGWSRITHLSIVGTARMKDAMLSVASMLAIIAQCKALIWLRVCSSRYRLDPLAGLACEPSKSALLSLYCTPLSAATIEAIVAMCPNLHMLGFVQPLLANNTAAQAAALPLVLPKNALINYLSLESCSLTPSCLETIEGMELIVLDACTGLTDAALASLAQRCPQLEILHIANCPQLTVTSITGMLKHCPELRSLIFLTLGNKEKVGAERTPQSKLIDALVTMYCPRLRTLSIN